MTHLILHKVRGEPAFDVAERCDDMGTESDPGPWWIIPTSGHRAYPWVAYNLLGEGLESFITAALMNTHNLNEVRDHYQNEDTGTITSGVNVMAIVSKMLPKIKRRL